MKSGTPYFLGIAGGSASGKTTLARTLVEHLGPERATVISLDSYYRCLGHLSPEERASANFDHPKAFEFDLLAHQLEQLANKTVIETPSYCYVTHTRLPETQPLSPAGLVIVEGIFTLYWDELRQKFHRTLFVEAHSEARLSRRINRDTQERGRTPESVRSQWAKTVEPMYQQYCHPTKGQADATVDGERDFSEVVESLVSEIEKHSKL